MGYVHDIKYIYILNENLVIFSTISPTYADANLPGSSLPAEKDVALPIRRKY